MNNSCAVCRLHIGLALLCYTTVVCEYSLRAHTRIINTKYLHDHQKKFFPCYRFVGVEYGQIVVHIIFHNALFRHDDCRVVRPVIAHIRKNQFCALASDYNGSFTNLRIVSHCITDAIREGITAGAINVRGILKIAVLCIGQLQKSLLGIIDNFISEWISLRIVCVKRAVATDISACPSGNGISQKHSGREVDIVRDFHCTHSCDSVIYGKVKSRRFRIACRNKLQTVDVICG